MLLTKQKSKVAAKLRLAERCQMLHEGLMVTTLELVKNAVRGISHSSSFAAGARALLCLRVHGAAVVGVLTAKGSKP